MVVDRRRGKSDRFGDDEGRDAWPALDLREDVARAFGLEERQAPRGARVEFAGDVIALVAGRVDLREKSLTHEVRKVMVGVSVAAAQSARDLREMDPRVRPNEVDDVLARLV